MGETEKRLQRTLLSTEKFKWFVYKGIGCDSVKVTGWPVSLTQRVRGSFPICSLVEATDAVAGTGKVTGTGAPHVLPLAVSVAPTMDLLSVEYL